MKKYFLSIVVLAGMLFATSCQESLVEPQMEGPTTFTVQLPDAMGTKAIGDASSVNTLYVAVYDQATSDAKAISKDQAVITGGKANVQLNLIQGVAYDIVFWAQQNESFVNANSELVTIDVNKDFENSEDGAVFYAYVENFVPNGTSNEVTLRRPFAQLNLGTTTESLTTAVGPLEVVSTSLQITEVATKFVTVSGLGENTATRTLNTSGLVNEDLTVNGTTYKRLSMDYLTLVDGNKTVVDVVATIIVKEGGIERTIVRELKSVPVMKNVRTNIVGNFISSESTFTVEVDDTWNEAEEEVYDVEWGNLLYAAQNGGEVTLSADVKMPHTLIVADDKEMVLNLNGHDIIVDNDSDELGVGDAIVVYGNLTIKGEGKVQGNTRAVWARGEYGATVRIEGGHYIGSVIPACEVIYASGNGVIEILGGKFEANEIDNNSFAQPQYAVLNLHGNGAKGCNIIVYGGSFKNFNPADNISENPKHNFCAPGYGVYQNGDWYEVMYTAGVATIDAVVNNADELGDAIANGKKNIVLAAGVYGTILAQTGITYIGSEEAKVDCINLNGADNVTIKNIAFDAKTAKLSYDGKGNAKQYANIISGDSSKKGKGSRNIVIESCEFNGTFTSGGAAIAFTDQSRGSGQSGNISIVNCSFNAEGAYYHIYGHYFGYAELNIEGNKFTSSTLGTPIYLGRYQSSTPIVLKNNVFEKVSTFEDAIFVQDHGGQIVTNTRVDASGNTFAN